MVRLKRLFTNLLLAGDSLSLTLHEHEYDGHIVKAADKNFFTPKHNHAYSPNCFPYISQGADMESFAQQSRAAKLVIIPLFLRPKCVIN